MGIGLSAQGVNMNRLPGKLHDCCFSHMYMYLLVEPLEISTSINQSINTPVFTLGSVYSTKVSRAEQATEASRSN